MRIKAETMRNALLDPKIATVTVVTIPEKAAVMESWRLIQTVESHGVHVESIIINHVMMGCDCQYCSQKKASQAGYIDQIRKTYDGKRIAVLPDFGGEVKGEALEKVAQELYGTGQLVI